MPCGHTAAAGLYLQQSVDGCSHSRCMRQQTIQVVHAPVSPQAPARPLTIMGTAASLPSRAWPLLSLSRMGVKLGLGLKPSSSSGTWK